MSVVGKDWRPAASCRSCTAPVRWVRIKNTSKLMPLDAEPDPLGLVEVLDELAGPGTPYAVVHGQQTLLDDGNRYTSHFATCPQAAQWRKTR